MTSKEALEIIGNIDIDGRYPYPNHLKHRYKKEYEVLEKLVERDTPKKPLMSTHGYTVCPNCFGNGIRNNGDNDFELDFCTICGQRLKCSDKDET